MNALPFISSRVRFRSRAAVLSIAVSFFVITLALAISAGFRGEILDALAEVHGDITVSAASYGSDGAGFDASLDVFAQISALEQVKEARPVIYAGAMVRSDSQMHGVMLKGVQIDSLGRYQLPGTLTDGPYELSQNGISIPRKLAVLLQVEVGDVLDCYIVSERVAVRKLRVESMYDAVVTDDDKLVVYCTGTMLARAIDMPQGCVSAVELLLRDGSRDEKSVSSALEQVRELLYIHNMDCSQTQLMASSLRSSYPQLFDWLALIDSNVLVVLLLMLIVAAVNMISSLLILLFENIPFIGLLKTLGMRTGRISALFLLSSSREIAKGLAAGQLLALALCLAQQYGRFFPLDPENYFLSFVPVRVNLPLLLLCDLVGFAIIVLSLLIPCRFIAGVDPTVTLRAK